MLTFGILSIIMGLMLFYFTLNNTYIGYIDIIALTLITGGLICAVNESWKIL